MPQSALGLVRGVCSALSIVLFLGCQKAPQSVLGNPVVNNDPNTNTSVGEGDQKFTVYGENAAKGSGILAVSDPKAQKILKAQAMGVSDVVPLPPVSSAGENSLVLGFPLGLLGQQNVFGSVITKVSDTQSDTLGRLKLTDLTPLHVTPHVFHAEGGGYVLGLIGCVRECEEGSTQNLLLAAPVIGVSTDGDKVLVDLSSLGKELNLLEMVDPDGEYTQLKTKSSVVKLFDYSASTLVFDIDVTMVPKAGGDTETSFTTRWYLRLTSTFSPEFTARVATPGVGFFMTERAKQSVIQRFPLSFNLGGSEKPITTHYFIKDVPAEHRAAFAASFDMWNAEFRKVTGKDQLSYEFVEASDPRYPLLVTGDTRFNIVEWDLVNQAPYGGLGPSIANQHTGEILSANVLIQGPRVVQIYTKWFAAAAEHEALIASGKAALAESRWLERVREIRKLESGAGLAKRFSLKAGRFLEFRVPAQLPSLEDPLFQRDDFVPVPKGFTYEKYMVGYFKDMVAHELGHNLGLRHNFRGNLGATNPVAEGGVSRSIMEYLGRAHRHLDLLGDYDLMAISYGYRGKAPEATNQFCTDEDVAEADNIAGAAECSRDDATADPFSYFETQLDRALDLLLARGSSAKPVWTVADMDKEIVTTVKGLSLYALTAATTMDTWTNFGLNPDRPTTVAGVTDYVRSHIKARLCDKSFAEIVAGKESDEAKAATLQNLSDFYTKSVAQVTDLKAFTEADLKCESDNP